ncbi:PAS domain-containing protein [Methylocucumis oryzae]|uniref:PAS domain-containing protein n=1 Tax=Methylocucumis oryzae TaxID=1632867 RepID=A0A0F3ILD7_9GAMM|nr:PAS domain S-box protein [Methylocucumis oryzae]KJV07328.1 hypothetical protein VZ94_05345 [Methylocucumis oryzae]
MSLSLTTHLPVPLDFVAFACENMHDAVYLIDSTFKFKYVNQSACQTLGYSQNELLNMGVADIDFSLSPVAINAMHQQVIEQGYACFETRHQRKDGSSFPVEVNITQYQYNNENMSLCVVRDITERKRLYFEKQQLIDALEESADFISYAELNHTILFINIAGLRMVGLDENTKVNTLQINDLHPKWVIELLNETAIPTALAHGVLAWRKRVITS